MTLIVLIWLTIVIMMTIGIRAWTDIGNYKPCKQETCSQEVCILIFIAMATMECLLYLYNLYN